MRDQRDKLFNMMCLFHISPLLRTDANNIKKGFARLEEETKKVMHLI